jgi:signal transduction histidine kinase/uncharacterized membrane protein YagU involved in acid resistance
MARSPARRRLKYGGFVVAAVGFVLTRSTVLASVQPGGDLATFLVVDAVALTLGFALVAFGLGLAVSTYTPTYAAVVAFWCLVGAGAMAVVSLLSYVEAALSGGTPTLLSRGFTANVLLAGAVGGVLIGVRSAANYRQRRRLLRQSDQVTVLNRILRHEVLNKTNVILNHADLLESERDGADPGIVRRSAERIDAAIQRVGFLTRSARRGAAPLQPVDLAGLLRDEIAHVREESPDARFHVDDLPDRLHVLANPQLNVVLRSLLENAVEHNDADTPVVTVSVTVNDDVSITVADNGPGLPRAQQDLLLSRTLPEYDDPTAGFGLTLSRLLVERYRGDVDVRTGAVGGRGTAITVTLSRVSVGASRPRGVGVPTRAMVYVSVAAVFAGALMGWLLQSFTGTLPVIGALYGVASPVVGWITHLFHSVVFGLAFVTAVPAAPGRDDQTLRLVGTGVTYGIGLWLVAAGVVMPLWLRSVGVPATLPNLDSVGLVGHVVWGVALALGYAVLSKKGALRFD